MRAVTLALVVGLTGCTWGAEAEAPATAPPTTSGPAEAACPSFVLERNDGECVDTLEVDGAAYEIACEPVNDVLLDVPVDTRWGGAKVHTIVAVASLHAVAVRADDPRCGTYAVAFRHDLTEATTRSILDELRRAASLPPDLER